MPRPSPTGNAPVLTAVRQTEPETPTHPPVDDACQLCHEDSQEIITFPSGEELPVAVDTAVLAASVHGDMAESPLACADCHRPIDDYHTRTPVAAESLRDWQIERSSLCENCHVQPHLVSHPGPESENPVVCTDCHDGHAVQSAESWHTGANIENCTVCHEAQGVDVSAEMAAAVTQSGLFATREVG